MAISPEEMRRLLDKYQEQLLNRKAARAWLRALRKRYPQATRVLGMSCPKCGHKSVYFLSRANYDFSDLYQCRRCGHKFTYKEV